jgi:large subunit ribosomal protein L18Ae
MVKARQNANTHNIHQYLVVGRSQPTAKDANPRVYKMRIFASDVVHAKSKFWYFLKRLNKIKRSGGDVLSVNEVRL